MEQKLSETSIEPMEEPTWEAAMQRRFHETLFEIPEKNIAQLQERFKKLNRKAAKLGCAPVSFKILKIETVDLKMAPWTRRYYHIEVEGVAPTLADWTFVGTLEHTLVGNIVKAIPGQELPPEYRTQSPKCDHCKKIRKRRDTYIVKNINGEFRQVGHSCVRDFLGGTSPSTLAWLAECLGELNSASEEGGSYGGGKYAIDPLTFLEYVSEFIIREGWVSSAASRAYAEKSGGDKALPTTSGKAWHNLFPGLDTKEKPIPISEAAKTEAAATLEYVKSFEGRTDLSGYEHNLFVACSLQFIDHSNTGLVASAVAAYRRHMGIEEKKRIQAEKKKTLAELSQHFGTVGERAEFTLKVDGEHIFEDGQFGTRALYRLSTPEGYIAVWWTGKQSLEIGKIYLFKCTVKKHDVWNDIKQTRLTRCKVVDKAAEAVLKEQRKKEAAEKKALKKLERENANKEVKENEQP